MKPRERHWCHSQLDFGRVGNDDLNGTPLGDVHEEIAHCLLAGTRLSKTAITRIVAGTLKNLMWEEICEDHRVIAMEMLTRANRLEPALLAAVDHAICSPHEARSQSAPLEMEPVDPPGADSGPVGRFQSRLGTALCWEPPDPTELALKPWLAGTAWTIFLGEVGDVLARHFSFDYLRREVLRAVRTPAGCARVWLWWTRRPERLAQFGRWLEQQGERWPANLGVLTSLENRADIPHAEALSQVPAALRGVLLSPPTETLPVDLSDIDWIIIDGRDGNFATEWASTVLLAFVHMGIAPFVNSVGRLLRSGDTLFGMQDPHGADWREWPRWLHVRRFPEQFYHRRAEADSKVQAQTKGSDEIRSGRLAGSQ
jgi:hypothetical protein